MRFTLALLGAAIAGSACASFTIDRADYLSLHRRVKSIRRTRRAQASPTVDLGTPIVLSRNVVCPTIAGFGGLVFYYIFPTSEGQSPNGYLTCGYPGGSCYYDTSGAYIRGDTGCADTSATTLSDQAVYTFTRCPSSSTNGAPLDQSNSGYTALEAENTGQNVPVLECGYYPADIGLEICTYSLVDGSFNSKESYHTAYCPASSLAGPAAEWVPAI